MSRPRGNRATRPENAWSGPTGPLHETAVAYEVLPAAGGRAVAVGERGARTRRRAGGLDDREHVRRRRLSRGRVPGQRLTRDRGLALGRRAGEHEVQTGHTGRATERRRRVARLVVLERSEARRVGQESRSRWSPYH